MTVDTQLIDIGSGLFATVDAGTLDEIGVVNFRDGRQWTGRIGSVEWRAFDMGRGIYVAKTVYVAGKPATILLHRAITAAPGNRLVDHRNGNPLDNTRLNLRECSHADNMSNRKRQKSQTGFKGVYNGYAGSFGAKIKKHNQTIYLGTFDTAQEAADAYDAAAIRLHGEFARTNSQTVS